MIKSTFLLILFSLSISTLVEGQIFSGPTNLSWKNFDSLVIYGPAQLKLVKAKTLEIKGSLEFSNLDVADIAEINGTIKGEKGKFGKLNVIGSAEIDHVECGELQVVGPVKASYLMVSRLSEIVGPLDVTHGKFANLIVTADTIILEDVTLEHLKVGKSRNKQILILKGSTVINGDVIFESGSGQIQVQGSKVQIKGVVTGAIVQKL